ncbi:MAG: hypothetical protein CLLPBCKN_004886 [Chroococcidiopsis cubana SAG 39.79]|uniref:DUF4326 domain-containing protein n=1 Tax=Chroococcidiopsis cubana SAG 39.79 TaxID=388085 RepID=A0AB37UJL8_9CYAN|nr:DUF4326 domain-containing protein [Chroococcidiopsis cubana]MDZ4875490.1 hypothetical protein [Chroococcidiopsis cubana SAG 39.79]PSB64153.1 hypothetical protein C7B79_10965 [Chroococcidiopsis cubana CCALA 043]RUT11587.1 hypothetical protein DSM107010_30740 [Chroococcidiopsis cubana SAG 39.79]
MIIVDAVTGKVKKTDVDDEEEAVPIVCDANWFNDEHKAINESYYNTVLRAKALGEALIAKKAELGHGNWLPWVKENLSFSPDTAGNYMTLAGGWNRLSNSERARNLSLRQVLKELKEGKPKAREEKCLDQKLVADSSAENKANPSPDALRMREKYEPKNSQSEKPSPVNNTVTAANTTKDESEEDDSNYVKYELDESDCQTKTIDTKSTDLELIDLHIRNPNWSDEERNLYRYRYSRPIVINVMKHPNLRKWAEKEGIFLYTGYGDSKKHGLVGNKKWGNPFYKFDHKDDKARAEAIESYKKHFHSHPELFDSIEELKDKVLGCWCHPKPCHCDFLVEQFIAKQDEEEEKEYQQALSSKELNNYNSYKLYLYTPSNAGGDDEEIDSIYVSPRLLEYFKKLSVKYNDDREGLLYSILEFAENFERLNKQPDSYLEKLAQEAAERERQNIRKLAENLKESPEYCAERLYRARFVMGTDETNTVDCSKKSQPIVPIEKPQAIVPKEVYDDTTGYPIEAFVTVYNVPGMTVGFLTEAINNKAIKNFLSGKWTYDKKKKRFFPITDAS